MKTESKKSTFASHKVLTIIGIVLCALLLPILIINLILIIKSYTHQDKVPAIGGICPLIVLTDSMVPEINSGDLVIVRQADGQDVKEGDIIAFFDPDGNGTSVLTHRVKAIQEADGQRLFVTKGDANNAEDRKPVEASRLIGIYQGKLAGMGHVAMFMQSVPGLIICVVLPLVLLVGYDLIRRRRYEKRSQKSTDALLAELEELKAQKALKEQEALAEQSGKDAAPDEKAVEASEDKDDPKERPEEEVSAVHEEDSH